MCCRQTASTTREARFSKLSNLFLFSFFLVCLCDPRQCRFEICVCLPGGGTCRPTTDGRGGRRGFRKGRDEGIWPTFVTQTLVNNCAQSARTTHWPRGLNRMGGYCNLSVRARARSAATESKQVAKRGHDILECNNVTRPPLVRIPVAWHACW